MNKQTERLIDKIYNSIFKKIFTKNRIKDLTKGNLANVNLAAVQLQNSKKFNDFAKKFSKQLSAKSLNQQKGLWKKYYQAAKSKHIGVLADTYSEFEKQMFEKVVKENFKMISSIPTKVMNVFEQKGVQTLLQQTVAGKIGRKSFETELKKHGSKNAKLIARTESAKLQTAIDEYRATSLGSVCYEWLSSKDKRTRKSHQDMNGVIVFWRNDINEKPLLDNMRGNAGEFPNCRCTTLPILDENDLTKSQYKLYNYKTNKVVTVSKKTLLDFIKLGHL